MNTTSTHPTHWGTFAQRAAVRAPSERPCGAHALASARRPNPYAALLAALFALAGLEMLASQALAQQAPAQQHAHAPAQLHAHASAQSHARAPARSTVSPRCAAGSDAEQSSPRERQPLCTLFHCY